jgi:predicted porin
MPIIDGVRWNNSIAYASPKFSGVDFMAIYSFGERVSSAKYANGSCDNPAATDPTGAAVAAAPNSECADTSDSGALGLGVRYANGPLYLTAVYHVRANDDSRRAWNGNVNTGYGAKGWAIGGTYDFKVAKLYANYIRAKANDDGLAYGWGSVAGSDKQTAWSLGVGVPVSSAGTVVAEYAQYKDYVGGSVTVDGVVYGGSRAYPPIVEGLNPGHKAKAYAVGYKHVLSKRTSLYGYVSYFDNDEGINVGWGKTGVAGEKQTNFTLGILHVF